MGKVWINNSSGETLYQGYYGADVECEDGVSDDCLDEYRLDGVINDLEIRHARIQLEKLLRQSWFNPIQPWKIQATEPVATPDGFSMKVSVHLDERYLGSSGWWIFQPEETTTKDVVMTMRWENGSVRLYQCEPPPYSPPPSKDLSPQPVPETESEDLWASLVTFLGIG